ncbi:unnamed protein product [Rotaria magnacalcarata]|uniref:Uncharacterized protein n=1 Tax=Rotaria magnacalcarata TaxID=392030 RepID=A0A815JDT6_9BILA|nr:unnamed protein product [Rotaria magnacalcarata]CAF1571528.1 unnamed protein product [Rotaria magnacalcarata]CAF1928886.1 unnamed protein product [Rotaria magnacalcarata]CAF2032130.1 unnamed protein product [Rotaria magnacalcarata]CAF2079449.1 unnamed protein product [Rotaria magnacalcarata]
MISRSTSIAASSYLMLIKLLIVISYFNRFVDAQVCTPDVCNKHGTCMPNAINSFACQCDPGFVGPTCNQEVDECESQPCANNGTCTDLENGFLCHCLPEWNGTLCAEAKNPCQSSPCGPTGKCIATNHAQIPYYCQCPDGQNTMFKCADPNPCLPNPCGPGECEITANLLNGYICRCFDGTIQMTNCSAPKNPCASMPCGSQGRCLVLNAAPKGYMCMCQVDGVSYTTIDTCPVTSSFCTHMSCKNGGICVPFSVDEPSCSVDQIGSTCCQCPPNFTGLRCEQEVDLCSSNPCKANGRCQFDKFGYRCQCFEGYTGENCDVRIMNSGCASNPCTVGICYQLNQSGASYVCICPDGTLNLSCNSQNSTRNPYKLPAFSTTTMTTSLFGNNVKFRDGSNLNSAPAAVSTCSPTSRDVCNGGQCLLSTTGAYACRCREGYTGAYCENNINECASNPCLGGGTCYDLVNAYACFCPDRIFRPQCNTTSTVKYTPTSSMSNPNDKLLTVKEEKPSPRECLCRNGGKCYTTPGSGKLCQCPSGFTGPFCETSINAATRNNAGAFSSCSQVSCENGATCQEQGSNSACMCKPGFTGQRCELEYFRCQNNGRFADVSNCKHGRYFECVYYGQYDLNLPNGILYSRSCPPGLRFSTLSDRCDYSSVVQC